MTSPRDEFALLLAAPDPVEAEMARELLTSAGIPSVLHGNDRYSTDLGSSLSGNVWRPDLLVPKTAFEQARALLREAWDSKPLSDDLALEAPVQEVEVPRSRRSALLWFLFAGIIALALLLTYSRFLGGRTL
jgi:hypothetical protein